MISLKDQFFDLIMNRGYINWVELSRAVVWMCFFLTSFDQWTPQQDDKNRSPPRRVSDGRLPAGDKHKRGELKIMVTTKVRLRVTQAWSSSRISGFSLTETYEVRHTTGTFERLKHLKRFEHLKNQSSFKPH